MKDKSKTEAPPIVVAHPGGQGITPPAELAAKAPPHEAAVATPLIVPEPPAIPPADPDEVSRAVARQMIERPWRATPLVPYNPDPDGSRRMATSFDLGTPEGKHQAYRAATAQDHHAKDVIGQAYPIIHWLQHDCQRADIASGEIHRWVRTVLITEDGTRISCGSDGVVGSLMSLQAFYGVPPWTPALPIAIMQGRSQAGRTFTYLDVR